jgi:hypothetical protein
MMMKTFRLNHFAFLVLFLFAVTSGIFTQESAEAGQENLFVRIDQIIDDDFPNVKAYVVVQDDESEVMAGLAPGLFQFRIDSMEADVRAEITPFAMDEKPIDYSIIFSNNGIMDGEPLDFQKNAILQFVDSMKDTDTLSLYTIGEEAVAVFEELTKDGIDPALINGVEVSSAQPRLYDSVTNAVRVVQRRSAERKIIIIISDGRDQNSRFTKDQMNTVLTEAGIPVYAIGIRVLDTRSLSNLNEMADLTGASYIYTANVSGIPDMLKRINSRIIQPYVMELRVRNMKADELPHVLEISIDERDFIGKGEKTFTAVKVPIPRWVRWAALITTVVLIAVTIVLTIIFRIKKRKRMGITKQKCPVCKRRMKDSWDSCPFCKYLPDSKKKKTKNKKEEK